LTDITFMQWDGAFNEVSKAAITEPFEEQYGVRINQQPHDAGPQELVDRVIAGNHEFHLLSHWNYSVYPGVLDEAFQPIRTENVPNLDRVEGNFDPQTVGYDPKEDIHHVPYSIGGNVLVYNTEQLDEPTSWDRLLEDDVKGKLSMPGWLSASFGIAAQHADVGLDNVPGNVDQLWDLIEQYDQQVLNWWGAAGDMQNNLEREEVIAGGFWSGRAFALQEDDVPVWFTVPEEGTNAWIETYSIPADVTGAQRRTAEAFMNFAIQEEQILDFGSGIAYAVPYEVSNVPSDHIYADHPTRDLIDTEKIQVWDSSVLAEHQETWSAKFNEIIG
jgi:spermidine/putrescine transport system substrate-binding protein